ncbi:AAA-ATPase-like protein [Candidatus Vecturithrix granuli]|uniref:AAA-ATPase-like protein n=1 Tax=Vecturithrix granuli TaxID=1499967 RepID=A0A081BXZ2_VECG1|nr:AAA-ATPase-like protein [Candidatus Vecturithrix granuli]
MLFVLDRSGCFQQSHRLLIDEYDNFANEVLMAGRAASTTRYQTLIEGEGMLKTVFKTIKSGVEGRGIDHVFLTGVSPIVMSDVTSGFHISENLSLLMDSEPALEQRYADLIMISRPDMRQYQLLDFLLEFKYVGLKQLGLTRDAVRGMPLDEICTLAPVKAKLAESKRKLREYHQTLDRIYGGKLRLRVYSIAAIGFDRLIWQEISHTQQEE